MRVRVSVEAPTLRLQRPVCRTDPWRGVNGHQDLPLGGQLTSRSADTRNPGRRTTDLLVASGQWHHPLALGGLGQAQ